MVADTVTGMFTAQGWALVAVAGVTFVLRGALGVSNTTIAALCYILIILVVAARAPLAVTVITAVVAMVPFHFYFVPIIGSFVITDPLNWVVLVAFVSVGIIAGQLASSARHRAEKERAAQLALHRAELVSALLASLSHDLRTPLAATRVAIANANDEHLPLAERRRQAAVALEQVARLDRTYQDILNLARIETDAVTLSRQWVTPAEIVEAAIDRAGADNRVTIEAGDDVEAEIDPRLTSAALSHVIENALEYAPREGTISVRGWSDDRALHFSVTDTGPGFDEKETDRLFDAFYRGREASLKRQGSGLGLSIARGLLRVEGGAIHAERVTPHGARFTIVVPARQRPADVGDVS